MATGVVAGALIDVSIPLDEEMTTWPGGPELEFDRESDVARGDRVTVTAVRMSLHAGTHMDAPSHFIAGALSIDRAPLAAGVGPARVIEIHDPKTVTVNELQAYDINPGERILLKTRNSDLWDRSEFQEDYVSLTEEAARHVAARGALCVGIDYLSIGPKGRGTAVHRTLLQAGVWILEGLDLRGVEPGDYELICVPLRFVGGEASPVRALLRKS